MERSDGLHVNNLRETTPPPSTFCGGLVDVDVVLEWLWTEGKGE